METTDRRMLAGHYTPRPGRRAFGLTMLATVGALVARTADAFTSAEEKLLVKATQALRRFGISVSGATDSGRDVLTTSVLPQPDIQYDVAINEVNELGGIQPCSLTSVFQHLTEFSHYEMDPFGGIQPRTKTSIAEHAVTFERLVNTAAGIVPCTVMGIDPTLDSFDLFDEGAFSGMQPCVTWVPSVSQMTGSGRSSRPSMSRTCTSSSGLDHGPIVWLTGNWSRRCRQRQEVSHE